MAAELTVLSLGWGVQSWTIAAMVALGELSPVDFAIHADTTWERQATYEFAAQWTPWLEARGVQVVTVSDSQPMSDLASFKTDIPAYTLNMTAIAGDAPPPFFTGNGSNIKGRLRRQCTGDWKLNPMRRRISEELQDRGLNKTPGIVEQWIGITVDEIQRAKDSDVRYITHRFPLLELGMTRGDCLRWLEAHDLPAPVKSSCTFCPFHNAAVWQEMKRENGPDWQQAVEVDVRIRNERPPYPLFVHRSCIALEDAVTIPEDFGYSQLDLLASDDADAECDSGACFL